MLSSIPVGIQYSLLFSSPLRLFAHLHRELYGNDEAAIHRHQEDSDEDSEDTDEDEGGDGLTPALEVKILQTINSIRQRDPKIYKKDVTWFVDEEEDGEAAAVQRKAGKKKTYKDVIREQILSVAKSGKDDNGDDDSDVDDEPSRPRLVYDAEQEDIRRAFLDASKDGGDEADADGLLRLRAKGGRGTNEQVDKDIKKEVERMVATGADEKEKEADAFLKDFILGRKWADPDADQADDQNFTVGGNKAQAQD